jgi:hypothetical protein
MLLRQRWQASPADEPLTMPRPKQQTTEASMLGKIMRPGGKQSITDDPPANTVQVLGDALLDWPAIRQRWDKAVASASARRVVSPEQADSLWALIITSSNPMRGVERATRILSQCPARPTADPAKPIDSSLSFSANEASRRTGRRMAAACAAPRAAVPTRSAAASSPPAMEPVAAALSTAATETTAIVGELMARAALGF